MNYPDNMNWGAISEPKNWRAIDDASDVIANAESFQKEVLATVLKVMRESMLPFEEEHYKDAGDTIHDLASDLVGKFVKSANNVLEGGDDD